MNIKFGVRVPHEFADNFNIEQIMLNAFNMEPEVALEYLRHRGLDLVTTQQWTDLTEQQHQHAFTVAKVMQADTLQEIYDSLEKALREGYNFNDWKASVVDLLPQSRLKTIFQTNLQTSYMRGRYEQQMITSNYFPYLLYQQIQRPTKRHDHSLYHGKVFRASDPIWKRMYPPRGFNCFEGICKILTPSGFKSIKNIKQGDLVISGSGEERIVNAVHKNQYSGYIKTLIIKGNRSVKVTNEHPFKTKKGWVVAGDLYSGDKVISLDGENEITKCFLDVKDGINVYNLTVDIDATYVTEIGIVHNCGCRVHALTAAYVKENGILVLDGSTFNVVNEPGWDLSPDELWKNPRFDKYHPSIGNSLKKILGGL